VAAREPPPDRVRLGWRHPDDLTDLLQVHPGLTESSRRDTGSSPLTGLLPAMTVRARPFPILTGTPIRPAASLGW
jgi:hypothetical protein